MKKTIIAISCRDGRVFAVGERYVLENGCIIGDVTSIDKECVAKNTLVGQKLKLVGYIVEFGSVGIVRITKNSVEHIVYTK